MSRYGLEPSPDFWRARFERQAPIAVGADPPASGDLIISTDDVLAYANYVDAFVSQLDRATMHWASDPPGCEPSRCVLVAIQWSKDMGAMGPWEYWAENWRSFLHNLQTSYWARVNAWDTVKARHNELLGFLEHARALKLPDVPGGGKVPEGPLEHAGNTVGKGAEHVESILDKLLLGGALVAAVLVAREAKTR